MLQRKGVAGRIAAGLLAAGAAALVLTCKATEPTAVIDNTIHVTVTAVPGSIQPGQGFTATTVVEPSGAQVIDDVRLDVSGLLSASETVAVNAPGTFTLTRSYTVPVTAGVGQVTIRAKARAGGSLGEGGTAVAVADTVKPRVSSLTVTPTDSVLQPGDSLTVQLAAWDNVALRSTVIRLSGTLSLTDSVDAAGQAWVQRTLGLRIPRTVVLGRTLTITAEAIDVAGHKSDQASVARVITDYQPPAITASAPGTHGTMGFAPEDTIHLTLTARDNYRLARYGYRFSGSLTAADSFVVADTLATRSVSLPLTTAAIGQATLSVFAVDSMGHRTAMVTGTFTIADRVRRPIVSVPVHATVRDVAFDTRRGLLYLSEPESSQVAVLDVQGAAWRTPFSFAAGTDPRGLDVSLSGDSLFVAMRRTNHLAVIDLVGGTRDTLRVNADAFLNRGPDNVRVMANGKVLVSITFDGSGYGGTLVSVDPATRTFAGRATVTEVVPLCRSGDKNRLLALIDDSCCPIEGLVYDAAADAIKVSRGTVSSYFVHGSASFTGAYYLVNGALFDAGLVGVGSLAPDGYAGGASVIAGDGSSGFFAVPAGVAHARFADGRVVESFTLDAVPYLLAMSVDGLTLVAVTANTVNVIDLW